jgi:hypothetical protein
MTRQSTESLIEGLAGGLTPAKRLALPWVRILPWIIFAAGYMAAVASIAGLRADLALKLTQPEFVFEIVLVLIIGLSAALASAWMCVPDMRGRPWVPVVPLILVVVFMVWQIARMIIEGTSMGAIPSICIKEGIVYAAAPALWIVLIGRGGATTRPRMLAFMNVLAVSAFGYIGLRLTCPVDTPGHALFWHCIPYVILGAFAGIFARRMYRW